MRYQIEVWSIQCEDWDVLINTTDLNEAEEGFVRVKILIEADGFTTNWKGRTFNKVLLTNETGKILREFPMETRQ